MKPVFVMGLPRSGSTLLSRLLNATPDILSVNDLYFLQGVFAEDAADGPLTAEAADRLTHRLLEVIDTRAQAKEAFIGQFEVAKESLDRIRAEVLRAPPADWSALLDALLSRVAAAAGKCRWADKTPQNFYHFERLAAAFPDARFVFLFRDPRAVMASFRHAAGDGHDPRRYHPIVYALYWRSAVRWWQRFAADPRVTMVRYEDLVSEPVPACAGLSAFLETRISVPALDRIGHNSSFSGGSRQTLTPTETWIGECLCAREMALLGYAAGGARPQWTGLVEFARTSLRFATFQLLRLLKDRDARRRVGAYLSGLRA